MDRRESQDDRILALAITGGGITPDMAGTFLKMTEHYRDGVQSNPDQAAIQPRGDEEDINED